MQNLTNLIFKNNNFMRSQKASMNMTMYSVHMFVDSGDPLGIKLLSQYLSLLLYL